jgi:hypothetical protein
MALHLRSLGIYELTTTKSSKLNIKNELGKR